MLSVCIATCNRPESLKKTLDSLKNQKTEIKFEVIVVNNGIESIDNVIYEFKPTLNISVYKQEKKNISLTRNIAVYNSNYDIIVFIDDDEFAKETWLSELYTALKNTKGSVIVGPVKQIFPKNTPNWRKSFFKKPNYKDLTKVYDGHTGNALIKKDLFNKIGYFDENLGLTGGEDADFFKRVLASGNTIYWSNKAIVFETVMQNRLSLKWVLKRKIRCSQTCSLLRLKNKNKLYKTIYTFFRLLSIIAFLLGLPFSLFGGINLFYKYIGQICCQIGHATALLPTLRYKEYK